MAQRPGEAVLSERQFPAPSSPSVLFRLRGRIGKTERSFPLARGRYSVGSARSNDVVLPVLGVSREHARLRCEGGGVLLEDLGSRNGTFVNGERVRQRPVFVGDAVRFGPVKLRLEEVDESDVRLGVRLHADDSGEPTPIFDETTVLVGGTLTESEAATADLVFPEGCMPGQSDTMLLFYRTLRSLAVSELPVVIEGETGVGKESVARTLHLSSRRRGGPFVAINCAAIPGELLEAEMFGVAEGVATGVRKRAGRFRDAEGGTLLLDEIAEMPLGLQAKLLRALQEKEIQPLGASAMPVDVRVIAATNLDLSRRVEEGHFRRDLYYRVAGGVLRVPPLRERRDDVPLFVEHFLRRAVEAANKSIPGVTVRALRALSSYAWPGNVRELEHEVERLVHACPDGQPIESSLLPDHMLDAAVASPLVASKPFLTDPEPDAVLEADDPEPDSFRLEDHVQTTERRVILRALRHVGGSQRQAARLLGISRTTLARKIEKLGLTV